jgi:hypothetical protein
MARPATAALIVALGTSSLAVAVAVALSAGASDGRDTVEDAVATGMSHAARQATDDTEE